jgi:non-specific serine/threonine protein kinase
MDWSFALLKMPELQILMRRLSVFAGGWDLDAARSVCSGDGLRDTQIRKLLNRLAQASLIVSETQNESTRYRLLETVRAYAKRKLEEADETETVQDRHIEYYLGLAEGQEPYLNRKEQAEALSRLETEHDNFRQALNIAVNNEIRLRLAGALWRFWDKRNYFSEGRARLQQALIHTHSADTLVRAKVLNGLGVLSMRQSEHEVANSLLNESPACLCTI